MSWNYSYNPANSAKDQVRFLIGDTSEKNPLLQDEEIIYLLSLYNNAPLNAAVRGCEMIIAKFSRLADETVGSVSKSYSQQATGYFKMMEQLRTRIGLEDCRPYAGGISRSDKKTVHANTDRVRPVFTKHEFENDQIAPWVSETEYDEFLNLEI